MLGSNTARLVKLRDFFPTEGVPRDFLVTVRTTKKAIRVSDRPSRIQKGQRLQSIRPLLRVRFGCRLFLRLLELGQRAGVGRHFADVRSDIGFGPLRRPVDAAQENFLKDGTGPDIFTMPPSGVKDESGVPPFPRRAIALLRGAGMDAHINPSDDFDLLAKPASRKEQA